VRPAGVDPSEHTEIKEFLPKHTGLRGVVEGVMLPILRVAADGFLSPTRELARVLVQLASGDGEALSGKGIEGEGRTLRNQAVRRIGKEGSGHEEL